LRKKLKLLVLPRANSPGVDIASVGGVFLPLEDFEQDDERHIAGSG
jgi:hypothetical protein